MLLSVAAVGLSCALLIVVVSLFNGFIGAFEQSAVDAIGDVVLSPGRKFEHYDELIEQLEELGVVEAATATLSAQGLLHLDKGDVRAVEIWGIEVQKRGKVTAFEQSLLNEKKTPTSISSEKGIESYIGVGVLARPDEKTDEYDFNAVREEIGQEVVLTTGSTTLATGGSVAGGQGEKREFRRTTMRLVIADAIFTGVYYLDNRVVYVPIERLRESIYPKSGPIAGQIQIKLRKGCDMEVALAAIRGVWGVFASERLGWEPYQIQSAMIESASQLQSRYVVEIRKQMGVLLLIFGVVSMSAVLLIFCIFYMIVETRRKDISIVKSCGASSVSVAAVFLGFGAVVGVAGAAIGTGLGYIVTRNINAVEHSIGKLLGLKLWKASVYMFSRIPDTVDWAGAVPIVIAAIVAAAAGALIPAIIAARTRPVDILRYE